MATALFDPYATLGIPAGATDAEAARAHRRLAKQFHPDLNPGPAAAERMQRINEAWQILSDPTRRALYDASRRTEAWPRPGYRSGASTATWTTWPESRGRATPGARRPMPPDPVEPAFGDRPVVVISIGVGLTLLVFIATWLGSLAR